MGDSEAFLSEVALVDALTKTPLILFVAFHCGKLFALARLPKISGYLFAGVLCGSEGLGMLSNVATKELWPVNNVCLAIIGIAAGSELSLSEMRRKEFCSLVLRLTCTISACTWLFVFPVVLALSSHIGFLAGETLTRKLAVASLAATLGIARSPASMIAVLREVDGKGPFCSLVMSVTVVKDVLVLLLFAINVEIVASLEEAAQVEAAGVAAAGSSPLLAALSLVMLPLYRIALSFAGGSLGGAALGWALHPRVGRVARAPLMLALAASFYVAARRMHAEPLLVCVVAGAVAGNLREETQRGGEGPSQRAELHALLGVAQPWVNLAFFTLAGLSLAIRALAASAPVALALHLVRLTSLVVGCRLGGRGLPADLRRVCWMAMVTQAGVALGLARSVAARFSGWGDEFYVLMVSTIVLNQAVGPPLFRSAIATMGEAHHLGERHCSKGGGIDGMISLHQLPTQNRKL